MHPAAHLSDEVLSAYLDAELGPAEGLEARAHLDRCASCSGTLAHFSALDATLATAPQLSCSAARPLVSAALDGENAAADALVASAHLAACGACRSDSAAWAGLEATLASLPLAAPSPRVDAALAPLRHPRPAPRALPGLPAWPARAIVAVAVAVALVLLPSLPRGGDQASLEPDGALVASVQQSVFNPRTGTLYVLHPDDGAVAALDAATLAPRTLIKVGGRPSALALNEAANLILVLDAMAKTVTEIDGTSNAVIAATPVDVPGTPTSLQIDTNGKLVVTSIVVAGEGGAPAPGPVLRTPPPTSGAISVLDGGTKKLETVKQVDVAPRQVVIEPGGKRALLVSGDATTIVDAATYRALDRAVGGVAAAFSGLSGDFAILSVREGGALLSLSAHASVALAGSPRAITSLPGGGFAVLTDLAGRGRITVLAADGTIGATLDAVGTGRDLTFDDASRQLSIVGAAGVSNVALPSLLVVAPSAPASSAPLQTIVGASQSPILSAPVAVSPSPAPSASPIVSPAVAPSAPPATHGPLAAIPAASPALVPSGARLLCCDTYLYAPAGLKRAARVAGEGTRIWTLDETNRLSALHTASGEVFQIATLPASARIGALLVSRDHVYLPDASSGVLYVLAIGTEQWSAVPLPFVRLATGFVASPDERLWIATDGFGLISYEPRSGRIDTIDVGPGLSTALGVDGIGGVWLAPRDRGVLEVYDPLNGKLSELLLPHEGVVTSLLADHDGAMWAATDAGQIFAIRNGKLVLSTTIGRAIDRLVLGPEGAAWYVSRAGGEVTFGPADGSALALHAPAGVATPVFDPLGRSWTNDPSSAAFFVTLPGGAR